MTQTQKPRPGLADMVGSLRKWLLSPVTGWALRCPRCHVPEQLVGLDVTLDLHMAVYRCPVCGHEDHMPEPVFPYEG